MAAATPLRDGGASLDADAIGPMVAFLEGHGADGVFCCGTTGEGVLLTLEERQAATRLFRTSVTGLLLVHAGAQTTADTVRLAVDAAEAGADGVAVIPPPYFALDADALAGHLLAAAAACRPLPFFIYCFAARSGYAVPEEVIRVVAAEADNLAGLKVSESPYSAVEPYLRLGLPVLVGSEPLIVAAVSAGAHGAVSGLAAAWPDQVRAVLDQPDAAGESRLRALRAAMEAQPFIASVKQVLARRGLPVGPDVRPPLRGLTAGERSRLEASLVALGI